MQPTPSLARIYYFYATTKSENIKVRKRRSLVLRIWSYSSILRWIHVVSPGTKVKAKGPDIVVVMLATP